MSGQCLDESVKSRENAPEVSLNTRLDRRRRIEELDEEKRLREELEDYGFENCDW